MCMRIISCRSCDFDLSIAKKQGNYGSTDSISLSQYRYIHHVDLSSSFFTAL